ncbi:MAG: molybdopterin-guanine dinucleotide biosynthesis protein B [Deltaproteobacteria bacterium]|nr:molybdopterin-guanine dinucleotide biosynthesis protein B [Deltaproteobacteria bacterium]
MQEPPRLGFIGYSNSGKTTLICKLIRHLTENGFRVGAVKHHHKAFDIDHQGKDSYRFTAAGAGKTIITGPEQTALIEKTTAQIPLEELAHNYMYDLDLILVEGFKQERLPKIEIQRAELKQPLLSRGEKIDENLIAVVSDVKQELDVPCFGLEQTPAISGFICDYFSLQRPSGHANES